MAMEYHRRRLVSEATASENVYHMKRDYASYPNCNVRNMTILSKTQEGDVLIWF